MTIQVGIIGATGYTGAELIKILLKHPEVRLTCLTSQTYAGQKFSSVYPRFTGICDDTLVSFNVDKFAKQLSYAFVCLPHTEAMQVVPQLAQKGVKVIDLSADFRLQSPTTYKEWYGKTHTAQKLLDEVVYGLPELHREKIKKAFVVANPGCYPTGALLGLAPLLKDGLIIPEQIIIDSKSGTSGAGRSAKTESLYCEVNEALKAYNVGSHRHTPEIEQELSEIAGKPLTVSFTPHLVPMDRGLLSTIYTTPLHKITGPQLQKTFENFYKKEPFVRILPSGIFPNTKDVTGTNFCDIGCVYDPRNERIVIITALDNLLKGASGQAVQNFNLMAGFAEGLALNS